MNTANSTPISHAITLVVPCYNEESRLPVEAFAAFMEAEKKVAFCFVNDGSRDETQTVLDGLASRFPGQAGALPLSENVGKAEAIRQGVQKVLQESQPDWLGYWDADLATPLAEIHHFYEHIHQYPKREFFLGARVQRLGATVRRRNSRHYFGRIFGTLASRILGMPVYDTQCGAKMLRADLAQSLFEEPFLTPWLFDVELLARLRNMRGKERASECLYEIPLHHWEDVAASKLSLSDYLRVPWELWKIARKYGISKT